MSMPRNGVAKEIRSYAGSLFIFLFVIGIIVTLLQFPVLRFKQRGCNDAYWNNICKYSNNYKFSITGTKPDDVNALKQALEKKEHHIELLVSAKDQLEAMVIDLQKQMLENQENVMDKIILKAAIDFDDKNNPPKNKRNE